MMFRAESDGYDTESGAGRGYVPHGLADDSTLGET